MATTVVPNVTPQTGGAVKGRRKLEFTEAQRFKGKHFFLDLKGYKRVKDVLHELTSRGATVQDYMDKNVRYVITNQSQSLIDQAKSNRGSSNPTTPSTGGMSQLLSPMSATPQSPHTDKKPSPQFNYFTRSRKMVEMVKGNVPKSASSDVLLNASRWNIKIVHVDAVEKELKKLKPLSKKKEVKYKKPTPKYVRKLREPFFKIEDKSRQYRPIIYETSEWPCLNMNCPIKASPFDPKCNQQLTKEDVDTNSNHSDSENGDSSSSTKSCKGEEEMKMEEGIGNDKKKIVREEKRAGFCEPCSVRYEDLIAHLKSQCHQMYANNESNFTKLDELIAQCTSLDDFLAETRRFSRSSITPEFNIGSPVTVFKSPLVREPHLTLKKVTSPAPLPPLLKQQERKRVGWTSPYRGSRDLTPAKKTKLVL